jgi:hypothetical protein
MVSSKGSMWIGFRSRIPGIALLLMVAFVGLASAASAFASNTYYVSKSAGSDVNAGTSKSAPWAHLPGMASWTGSHTPTAGDTFVLMGCDVWVNADLPVIWNWNGSAGNVITIGVDKTTVNGSGAGTVGWYNTTNCPSGWNRPIFDAQSAYVTYQNTFFLWGFDPTYSSNPTSAYGVLDNIEMRGLYCSNSGSQTCANTNQRYGMCFTDPNGCTNWTFSNLYLHGWNIATDDYCHLFQVGGTGTVFTQNVVDGSDSTPAGTACEALFPGFPSQITNNVIHDLPNGIVGSCGSGNSCIISGNLLYNMTTSNGAPHCNMMEITGAGTHYIFNNVLHDASCAGGEALMLGSTGETSYVFNNLMYNMSNFQAPNFPQTGTQAITGLYFWNNTIVTGGSGSCFYYSNQSGGTLGTLVIQNNHCISTAASTVGSLTGITISSQTITPNTLMTPTTATSQGYTSSETYVYSPTAGTNSTVGAGTQICGVAKTCTGNFAALASDTSYSCTQQTVNGVVQAVCPARTVVPRQKSAGAYEYASGGSAPTAPTRLTAVVH